MRTLKQSYNSIIYRIWNPCVYDYQVNFRKALVNTKKLGLNEVEFNQGDFEIDQKQEIINTILHQLYDIDKLHIEDVALKCFTISKGLQGFLKSMGLNSLITTGNVYFEKKEQFHEKFSTIKRRIKDQNYNKIIKSHTWLTLENLDIIDLTIIPSYWLIGDKNESSKESFKKILWCNQKKSDKNGWIYEPKIIGYEYFEKINIVGELFEIK